MTKKQQRWKLEMELKRYLLKGGKVVRCKTGVPTDYQPYDTDTTGRQSASIDNNFQIKGSVR